ncbi:MAG: translocation/assembly module TamB domain-containing protein [Verrucomicrobia bacterium]|nr:translocation/assembly module TamB domain-containing protein [Verrucomicrobiota bacterium]
MRPPRRRRVRRWLGAGGLLLGLGLVWLNGPGLRWLGPQVARHFLLKAGLTGGFRIEGSLSGGLSVADLKLAGSGRLAGLTVERVTPHYHWSRLVKGQLDGLTLEGAHADLRLGLDADQPAKVAEKPLDLEQLVQILHRVRQQVVPVQLDFKRLSLTATRDGKPAFRLEPSRLSHAAGSDAITLEIGQLTDPAGREWPAQSSNLVWSAERLTVDRLDPLPGIGVRELTLHLPITGGPSLASLIHLDEAVLQLESSAGFAAAKLSMQSGAVDVAKTARSCGIELPATATATLASLSLEVANLMPDPGAATGRAELGLQAIAYQDWQVPEALVSSVLEPDRATLTLRAQAMGSPVTLNSEIALARAEHEFVPGDAKGTFHVPNVPAVMRDLATRFAAIRPDAKVPESMLDGEFKLSINNNQVATADLNATLTPADPALASPLTLHARWQPATPASADLTLEGLKLTARYDASAKTYAGTLVLDGCSSSRIDPWLASAGVSIGGIATLTGQWSGSGDLSSNTHGGDLALTEATWQQPEKSPVTAAGTVRYDWPEKVSARGLQAHTAQHSLALELIEATWQPPENSPANAAGPVRSFWPSAVTVHALQAQTEQQAITLDATIAEGLLKLDHLTWRDGQTVMAEGSASLPVPQDFSKWQDTLAQDTRPATVALESRVLSLALLQPWLPAAAQLDPHATGQFRVMVSGNYVEPSIDATLECLNLRSPAKPKLPPAALKLALKASHGHLALDGTVTAPDYAPARLSASMPFRPAAWAKDPAALKTEILTARAELPRLDLSRFTTLLPMARQLSGSVTGNLEVAGKLAAPEVRGTLHLTNAGLVFANSDLPALQAAGADLDLSPKAVTLKNLRASVAGGSLTGNGTLTLNQGQPGTLDFRLRGDHLPLLRNDLLILRANLDLRLQGPWESAALTGSVGAVDSLFYRDIELLPIGKPFTAPAAAALPKIDAPKTSDSSLPAPFGNWGLNVAVRTQEPFLIRGNLATGRVDVNLRLGGTLGKPLPDGVATLSEFVADLPFSTLKVKAGSVRFTPASGFDPNLEIRGYAEPRPYRIDVYAYGKLSDPQLVLTSNPPLPDNEIMTLLATGTTTAGLENTQAASSRAIQLFAEEVRRGRVRYAPQLRPLLGMLDRVDFSLKESDPYSSDSLSTATVTLSDRWLVSAGMDTEGNTRVMGIWRISFR